MPSVNLTPYDARLAEVQRQQQLAQVLQQQAQDPIQVGSFNGIPAQISPWQGAAKLANAIAAAFARGRAEKEQQQLESDQRQSAMDTLNQYYAHDQFPTTQYQLPDTGPVAAAQAPDAYQMPQAPDVNAALAKPPAPDLGLPDVAQATQPTAQGLQGFTPVSAQDRQQVAAQAMASGNPYLGQIAPTLFNQASKQAEQERMAASLDTSSLDPEERAAAKQAVMLGDPTAVATTLMSHASAAADKAKALGLIAQMPGLTDDRRAELVREAQTGGMKGLAEALKPQPDPEVVRAYKFAVAHDNYKGTLLQYQQDTNPNRFIYKGTEGSTAYNARDVLNGGGGDPVSAIQSAIRGIEAGNGPEAYTKVGPATSSGDHGYGAYQVMGANIPKWTQEVLGQTMTPQQFLASPQAQDAVANAKLGQFYAQTGNPADVASMWHSGVPLAQAAGRADVNGMKTTDYAARVASQVGPKALVTIPPKVAQSIWDQVTPEAKAAISLAAKEGRYDASRLNSRNAAAIGQVLVDNPGINLTQNHGIAQLLANPSFQNKALTISILPQVIDNVAAAGKKVNFSDVQYVGKVQAYLKGQLNDPDFINYMSQRIDAMQTIAAGMRQNGATDQSIQQEIAAAPLTMSPRAWDAWANAQKTALAPRQEVLGGVTLDTRTGRFTTAAATAPAAAAAAPARPFKPPPGTLYSPSRHQYKLPNGQIVDVNGRPVSG